VPTLEASVGQLMKSLSYEMSCDPGDANEAPELTAVVDHIVLISPTEVSRIVFARRNKYNGNLSSKLFHHSIVRRQFARFYFGLLPMTYSSVLIVFIHIPLRITTHIQRH